MDLVTADMAPSSATESLPMSSFSQTLSKPSFSAWRASSRISRHVSSLLAPSLFRSTPINILDTHLGNVEQNGSRKIYHAKAQRFKFEFRNSNFEIFLGAFAPLRETWFFRSRLRFRISNTFGQNALQS